MSAAAESTNTYRATRRAFIAACDAAGVDAIARLHPTRGADGRPLFMDAAALGPRDGARALLIITGDAPGSAVLTDLMLGGIQPPPGARLVLVHAVDPAAFAGVAVDSAWPLAMLQSVATEDLSRVKDLKVLTIGAAVPGLAQALEMPGRSMTFVPDAPDRIRTLLASI
jgi:hypothetical protein